MRQAEEAVPPRPFRWLPSLHFFRRQMQTVPHRRLPETIDGGQCEDRRGPAVRKQVLGEN